MDHVAIRVRDLEASRRFYLAALAPLDFGLVYSGEGIASFGAEGIDDFTIIGSATPSTGVHVAFAARDRAAVDAFYTSALEAGGEDNGAPGLRPAYRAAFVLDFDGNNIEAVHHER